MLNRARLWLESVDLAEHEDKILLFLTLVLSAIVGLVVVAFVAMTEHMSTILMIFEVTRDYTISVPLMIANLCSYVFAQRLQRTPVYEALSHQEGITMPSAAHRPEPLSVQRAMRPLHSEDFPPAPGGPTVHPDDLLDTALQRMGEKRISEVVVVSRTGGVPVGAVNVSDILDAYQSSPHAKEQRDMSAANAKNWLATVGAITLAAVLVIALLVFWQRMGRTVTHQIQEGTKTLQLGKP